MIWMYVIIVIVILGLYGASMTYRYLDIHAKYHKQKIHTSLHGVLAEIISMIHKEDNMDKGNYKNTKASEYKLEPINWNDTSDTSAPNLTDLLSYQPTEEDYAEVLRLITELCQLTYNEFSFFVAKSSDETKAANFMQITSPYHEHTNLHKDIFRLAVKHNLDMKTLQEKFAEKAAKGGIIDIGDGVTIITKDERGDLATSVQPIQSGIEGTEITFIFSFVKTENYDKLVKKDDE